MHRLKLRNILRPGITALLILTTAVIGFSQNLDIPVSLNLKNKTLGEILEQISAQSGIHFSYSSQQIPVDRKMSIKTKRASVRKVLDELLPAAGLEYIVMENQVIIRPSHQTETSPQKHTPAVKSDALKGVSLSGYLKDKNTGEVLIGAYAYVKGSSAGTSSNGFGFYSLTLAPGIYPVVFSFLGYEEVATEIDLRHDTVITVLLQPRQTFIQAVEIQDRDEQLLLQRRESGITRMKQSQLMQLPGVAGDVDLIKALQTVPGIKSPGDATSMFFVRGGKSDQNLILVDDAPIYQPSHLFGFISALAPEAVKNVNIYKGSFPPQYGGRLSSVVDVRMRDGNASRFGMAGNLGPLVSDLALEGPFIRNKASWFVTGRFSNLNWIFGSRLGNNELNMNFYDIHTKLNFTLNKNNRIFLTLYSGKDVFERLNAKNNKTFGISWENVLGTLRWNHIFNSRLFSNTTLYYSRYRYYLYVFKEDDEHWRSGISNAALKSDFTWYVGPGNTIRMGIDISPHSFDPGNIYFSDITLLDQAYTAKPYRSAAYTVYAGNELDLTKSLLLKYGLRLNLWQSYGNGETVLLFADDGNVTDTLFPEEGAAYKTYLRPEPSVSLVWALGSNSSLVAGYSRNAQFLQLLNNSLSPLTSLDIWIPCGPNLKPQSADQFSAAFQTSLLKNKIRFSAEAYLKKFRHIYAYADHANLLFNPYLESELIPEKATAYGSELLLEKNSGKLTGSLAYTYSRVLREDVRSGESEPAFNDVPHELVFNFAYDNGRRWFFSLSWMCRSGARITTPIAFYYYNGYAVPVYGEKYNSQLPVYHRMDASAGFRLNRPERKFRHSLVLSFYNLYARKNPFSLSFSKIMDDNGNLVVPADVGGNNERIPTFMSVAGVIPSLNYKFRF